MSSRGTVTRNGHVTTDEYTTDRIVEGGKVLLGQKGMHGLPDFAHTPNSIYIKENADGSFRELRVYDENGFPILEIAYHGEKALTGNRHEKILHFHTFDENLNRTIATPVTEEIKEKYKEILRRYGLYD